MTVFEYLGINDNHLVQKVMPMRKSGITYPCVVQEKYDGVFCFAILMNNEVRIFSRVGNEYLSLEHLKQPLMNALKVEPDKQIILFEAYIQGEGQEIISGYCRDTQNQHPEIIGVVHDALTLDEYFGRKETSYTDRFASVRRMLADEFSSKLMLPVTINAYEYRDIELFVNRILFRKGEGVVIKNPSAPYQRGCRTTGMMKLKAFMSFDLEVIDLVEGTGKCSNMVGKIICRFKDDKPVLIGTGFTNEERKQWWNNPSTILGKVVQIDVMDITKNGMLREPSYKGIRYDKECADY